MRKNYYMYRGVKYLGWGAVVLLFLFALMVGLVSGSEYSEIDVALVNFMEADKNDKKFYSHPHYTCVCFSEKLVDDLNKEGFDASKLILRTHRKKGHIMVFVHSPDGKGNYIIEPQTDQIFRYGDDVDMWIYNTLGYHPRIIITIGNGVTK